MYKNCCISFFVLYLCLHSSTWRVSRASKNLVVSCSGQPLLLCLCWSRGLLHLPSFRFGGTTNYSRFMEEESLQVQAWHPVDTAVHGMLPLSPPSETRLDEVTRLHSPNRSFQRLNQHINVISTPKSGLFQALIIYQHDFRDQVNEKYCDKYIYLVVFSTKTLK